MYLTLKVPLYVNSFQKQILLDYGNVFHKEMDVIIKHFIKMDKIVYYPYTWVNNAISFYSKNAVIHIAEKFYKIRKKNSKALYYPLFTLMKNSIILNKEFITIFFGKGYYKQLIKIPISLTPQQLDRLDQSEIVKIDVIQERSNMIVRMIISIKSKNKIYDSKVEMGVDIGMKCPAVCYTSTSKIKFIGNGREIKYHSRRLQKKTNTFYKQDIKKFEHSHHRLRNYKTYIDHCISKGVVSFAVQQEVSTIYLEKLTNLQKKFYKHSHICWSYERLQTCILYKAKLLGINVVFVNPYLTSKRCPKCGKVNRVSDRNYICKCGFHIHRDIVGAMNILHAPRV